MPDTIKKISGMLNEEKWTRATLNDYAIGNFQELDSVIEAVINEKSREEVLELCNEHLEHTKNSIAALYIAGILSLSKQQVDDSYLLNLISIFSDNHKWAAVEYLCRRILEFGENKEALRTLAETLEHLNRQDDMYEVWERLIKVDYSETDIVKSLAEKREAEGDIEGAILYYRKAIHRYVNRNLFSHVRDIWQKLVEHGVDDYEFFFLIERKVAKSMSTERAVSLLEELYPAIKERGEWPVAIDVLKRILNYDSKNNWARQEIIQCYKERFAEHSQLEEYIQLSNLNQNWRNVQEAIADFEKHISFDEGSFVFHKTWGVGIIKAIKGDEIIIDFAKKRNHSMSLKMAVGALQSLSRDHVWVLKSIHSRDKLRAKVKSDIPWALKTIIRSFDNAADMKKIKAELVPTILTPGEWSGWSPEARKILKTDPVFGNVPDKLDQFNVRDKPMSFEEKTFNRFKAEKNFFGKVQAAREFLSNSDPDSEFFAEIFDYFTAFMKSGNVSPQVVASYLFVTSLVQTYPFLNPGLDWGFRELWSDMDNPVEVFTQIEDADIRRLLLSAVRSEVEDWHNIYLTLFPVELSESMIEDLVKAGYEKETAAKIDEIVEHFREYREGLIWVARHAQEKDLQNAMTVKPEKIMINMCRLYGLTFNDIENKREVSRNRKINRQVQNFLFKDKHLQNFLLEAGQESSVRIFTILDDIDSVDPVIKRDLKQAVEEAFPGIRFYGDKRSSETVNAVSSRYFFTVQSSLSARQKELRHIVDVEIPKNSKEIGAAIELGDLSENAEYKAGKEKQENLQIQAGKLNDELERARLFTPDDLEADKVGFGTVITLDDLINNKEEIYTIMGPWESNPSERVISYLSPFGNAFVGKKKGETLEFEINERQYKFTIKDVKPAENIY
ncbi:MAG: transcription elongation factor GreA [Spirochaetales bacterium]|nr:MAG: transcription elongation factor GreA [Spirochaetales bacterium]